MLEHQFQVFIKHIFLILIMCLQLQTNKRILDIFNLRQIINLVYVSCQLLYSLKLNREYYTKIDISKIKFDLVILPLADP